MALQTTPKGGTYIEYDITTLLYITCGYT